MNFISNMIDARKDVGFSILISILVLYLYIEVSDWIKNKLNKWRDKWN